MRYVFLSAILISSANSVRADTAPTAEQLREWARDLDNANFRKREAAARSLKQAGTEAAVVLSRTAKTGSSEASDRALRILGEMVEAADAKVEAAARRQLRRLADGESTVANEARVILNRKRNRLLTLLAFSGATYREDNRGVWAVDLDEVADMESVLPLLKNFPEIETLSISNKRFTDAGAAYLAELPNLQDLNLYQSNIGDEGMKHLRGLKNLRRIPMGETRVTDKGLKVIAGMTQLEYVGVRGNNVTDAGLAHLKDLTSLRGLYLGQTKITDDGLKHLATFTRLRDLYLHTTAITDAGLEHLTGLKDLRDLYLAKTKTTEDGHAKLKLALPDVEIDVMFPR